MIETIRSILKESHIETYLLEEQKQESVELFFIKQMLDMNRRKKVKKYIVTVFRDFEKNEVKMRGSSVANIYTSMSQEEIKETLEDAYYAAAFVGNPYYELPKGDKESFVVMPSTLGKTTLEDDARQITEALFKKDTESKCFINSAEVFVYKTTKRLVNSEGIDVSYEKFHTEGEFVAQCVAPQDVEIYKSFYYENLEPEAVEKMVEETLAIAKARAEATMPPKKGNYKVILSGEYVKTLMSYYLDRAGSNMIFPKYSNFKVDECVQGEAIIGDTLNITVKRDAPYSAEGIKMEDRLLMKEGKLQFIHGPSRFAHYLGIEATGYYTRIALPQGAMKLADMETGEYLHVVNFSDFQIDAFTGSFGGEIRLAFYSDGNTVIPVTGGSISGDIKDAQKHMTLTEEMQIENGYEGPYAVCLHDVKVAGE